MCQYCIVFFERLEIIPMDSPFTALAEENLLLDGSIGVMVFNFKKILQLGRRQKILLAPAYKPSPNAKPSVLRTSTVIVLLK